VVLDTIWFLKRGAKVPLVASEEGEN